MNNVVVQIKNSANTGNAPSSLANGELAINRADGRLFYKHANGTIVFLATGAGGGSSNAFSTVNVAGQSDVIADSNNDTLTLIAGTGIVLTTDATNDSVTIAATGGSAFDQFARDQANGAFSQANAAYANANTAIYTATQIRANLSNTAPINYNATTGVISHADSGAIATTYGNTTHVPVVTVDAKGHVTAIVNTAIALPSGEDQFARDQANAAYNQANTANTVAASAYVQANIATTNADAAFARANAAYANANTAIYTASQIRANLSNTAPINYDAATGIISHATSGVGATTYGNSTFVSQVTVDARGHVTSAANIAIDQSLAQAAYNQANTANTIATSAALRANTLVTDNVPETTTNLYFTAARVRANVSNTAPINYNSTTGVFSHADSAVTPTTYGNTSYVPQITVDAKGHVTAVTNVAISGGSLPPATANGQLLIGNTVSSSFDVNTLTAGPNIIITNDKGSITIEASSGAALDQYARDRSNGAFTTANAAYAQANIATTNADAAFTQANASGVLAQTARDHANGAFVKANAATPNTATANGQLMIGNTVSGGFDLNTLTAGYATAITNDKGSITVASTGDSFARPQANAAYAQANIATTNADAAFARANAAYSNANTAIYTASQIRANISNTAPINYDASTGIISHADSGVSATTYGNANFVSQVTVDAKGHVTSVSNVAIDRTLATTANTVAASAYNQANIATTNADAAFAQANAAYANANTAIYTAAQIRANVSNIHPVSYNQTTGQFGIVAANTNGSILISNTVSGGYDISQITGGLGIVVSPSQGGIKLDTTIGKSYYMVLSQASDVPTYNVALTSPSANAEVNTQAIFTGTSYSLTASFITPNGEPGTTLLPAGTFGRHFHATTDGASNYAQIRTDLYKRMANGTEVLLRSSESPIFSSANAEVLLTWNVSDATSYSLVVTDRLLWQVYVRRVSGGSGSVQVTVFYEGTSRASYITSTIMDGGADVFARIQANNAYAHANGAFNQANSAALRANTLVTDNVPETTSNLYFTAARVRANISNTAPINYDATTGIVSHADSGAVAGTYGNTTFTPTITVDAKGHVISVVNTAIALPPSTDEFARAQANAAYNQANTANTVAASAYAHTNTGYSFVYTDVATPGCYTDWATLYAAYQAAGSPATTIGFWRQNSAANLIIPSGTWTFANGSMFRRLQPYRNAPTVTVASGGLLRGIWRIEGVELISESNPAMYLDGAKDGNGAWTESVWPVFTEGGGVRGSSNTTPFFQANTDWCGFALDEGSYAGPWAVRVLGANNFGIDVTAYGNRVLSNVAIANNAGAFLQFGRFDGFGSTIDSTQTGDFVGTITTYDIGQKYGPSSARPIGGGNGESYYDTTLGAPVWFLSNEWKRLVTDNVPETTSNLYFTAARVRANISNTAPINYDASTGIISHAASGVVASGYGSSSQVPVFVVDANGHITSVSNVSISGGVANSNTAAAGSIQFNNAGAMGGSANLIWDNAKEQLRVRSRNFDFATLTLSNPSYPFLQMNTDAGELFEIGVGDGTTIWNWNAQPFYIGTNNATRMFITANGEVGIGTITPDSKLEVRANIEGYHGVTINNYSTNTSVAWAELTLAIPTQGISVGTDSAAHWLYGRNTKPIVFYTNETEKMRLTSDGKLGIGNTAPGHQLSVSGTVWTDSTLYAKSNLYAGYTGAEGGILSTVGSRFLALNGPADTFVAFLAANSVCGYAGAFPGELYLSSSNTEHISFYGQDMRFFVGPQPNFANVKIAADGSLLAANGIGIGRSSIPSVAGYDLLSIGSGVLGGRAGQIRLYRDDTERGYIWADTANGLSIQGSRDIQMIAESNLIFTANSTGGSLDGSTQFWSNATHEYMRADANGRIGINTIVTEGPWSGNVWGLGPERYVAELHVASDICIWRRTTGSEGPDLSFVKTRATTRETNEIVQQGDEIFYIAGFADMSNVQNSNFYFDSTSIGSQVDRPPTQNIPPAGRLVFYTNAGDKLDWAKERMRITGNGWIGIANTAPRHNLSINGNVFVRSGATLRGPLQDANGSVGSSGQYPSSNGNGWGWATIAIDASQVTSGVLVQAQGGTGYSGATANGQLLIGNTVSGGFDRATLTQGTNITITNDKGSITIAAAGGGGDSFGTISVAGQSDVVADQTNDILTLEAVSGSGVTITTTPGTDTVTFSATDPYNHANGAFGHANGAFAHANGAFAAANAASSVGKQSIWVPAYAMYPTTTNGASPANTVEMVTNLQILKTLDFDTTTVETAQFAVKMPKSWNAGTVTANAVWSHGTTATNFGVTWQVDGYAYADGDAIDSAFSGAVEFSDTGGTANTVYATPESGTITIANSPAKGEWIIFRVRRAVANASDTMAVDARLHGIGINYTTDASTDA